MGGVAKGVKRAEPIPFDSVIDSHMHIQSGACAPLPLVWNQAPGAVAFLQPSRSFMNTLAPIALGNGGKLQSLSTEKIGNVVIKENIATYNQGTYLKECRVHRNFKSIYSPMIVMPMDMEYAHISGFPPSSRMIYHEGKITKLDPASHMSYEIDGIYYYKRRHAKDPEEKGTKVDISHERPSKVWKFKKWEDQYSGTVAAVSKHPWKLLPMYHYEPRRWKNRSGTTEKNLSQGPWSYPFEKIASTGKKGLFIGFKMYPPLGYKPLDSRLPHLHDFYKRCEKEKIPILAHCSPGGMTTHDIKLYAKLDGVDLKRRPLERTVSCGYDVFTSEGYFFENYVHPREWRKVLMCYPDLKLCLAHFGGDEWEKTGLSSDWIEEIIKLTDPNIVQGIKNSKEVHFNNVYTDMSCFNLDESGKTVKEFLSDLIKSECYFSHMRDKLLFGTDWYLTLLTKGKTKYKEYCESFYKLFTSYDETLWCRTNLINPFEFFGFGNDELLTNLKKRFNMFAFDDKIKMEINKGYQQMKELNKQVDKIRKELTKV